GILALLAIVIGIYREFFGFPGEQIARVYAESVNLRAYTDDLTQEMQRLQSQTGSGLNQNNPGAASSDIQRLISAQETLPEDVLESVIEKAVVRNEAKQRGVVVGSNDIDNKVNELLSSQRDILNQPTSTP